MKICVWGAVLAGGLVCGCASKEFKSTPFYTGAQTPCAGEAKDRVNLWPVVYWRDPTCSVAWPVLSFSDDHIAVRPLYSQYRQGGSRNAYTEFNFLWPFAQADTRSDRYHVFPFFCGKAYGGGSYQAVFPVYWNGPHYNSLFPLWYYGGQGNDWSFNLLAGLAGARQRDNGYRASWMCPLWYEDSEGLFATPLYGQTPESYWFFPLWYKSETAFVSPLYAQGTDDLEFWWVMPPLLSWGGAKPTSAGGNVLLGLGSWYDSQEFGRWRIFPLMSREWHERKRSMETWAFAYLAGWKTCDDRLKSCYLFPLFSWEDDGSWLTPLGGRLNSYRETKRLFTPLVGTITGQRSGGWVIPFWSQSEDRDFEAKAKLVDSPRLPDSVQVSLHTNACTRGEIKTRLWGHPLEAADRLTVLLTAFDHQVRGWTVSSGEEGADHYRLCDEFERGNLLLFHSKSTRKIDFDLKSKAKIRDADRTDASFLVWLYQHERDFNRLTGDEVSRHQVLWRLWNWEARNDDVALDVFPGFTYDRDHRGRLKISLLWRLFRYERNQSGDTSVDFCFLPVWR